MFAYSLERDTLKQFRVCIVLREYRRMQVLPLLWERMKGQPRMILTKATIRIVLLNIVSPQKRMLGFVFRYALNTICSNKGSMVSNALTSFRPINNCRRTISLAV